MSNLSSVPGVVDREFANRRSGFGWLSYRLVGKLVAALDYVLIIGVCLFAGLAYSYFVLGEGIDNLSAYFGVGAVAATIFVGLSYDQYRVTTLIDFAGQLRSIFYRWSAVILIICLTFFLLKIGAYHSRGALISFSGVALAVLIGSRWLISRRLAAALANGTILGAPVVVLGDHHSLASLTRNDLLRRFGACELGRFELPSSHHTVQDSLAVIDSAIENVRSYFAEQVLLALPWANEWQRNIVCERLQVVAASVVLLPDQKVTALLARTGRNVSTDFTIELQRPPLSAKEVAAKRVSDLVLAGIIAALLAPLLAIVSLLIKLDSPGPVLFHQRRRGFNGREFFIYKFRTMHVLEDGDVVTQAQRNDKRVTRLGRVLRATSIDELPQLLNVLRGEMSLVGPRPHAIAHDDGFGKLIGNYAFRQHVKPGITGWAQVHGFRGETARLELMERRVVLDLWYVKHWSFWLDLRIVALTSFELLRRQDAY